MKNFLRWALLAMVVGFSANAAVAAAATPAADVKLGPGDILHITVYGNNDMTLDTRVSEAGSISYPLIGEVALGGLSTAEGEKKIARLLTTGGFLRDPQVNILVTTTVSQQVSILGQVFKPGRYVLDGGARTLTDMIALAGGVTPEGGDTVTLVRMRDNKPEREIIDLYAISHSGDEEQKIAFNSGDTIIVERAPRFYIYGEVQRPGVYRLERGMTVLQAMSVGGGLTLRGTERGMRIKRRESDGKMQTIDVAHDTLVQSDDIVYVKESWF